MALFSVDRRKRREGFQWCVLKDGVSVFRVATYQQAQKIAEIGNENAFLTVEKVERVDAVTRGQSYRWSHLTHVLSLLKAKEMR